MIFKGQVTFDQLNVTFDQLNVTFGLLIAQAIVNLVIKHGLMINHNNYNGVAPTRPNPYQ